MPQDGSPSEEERAQRVSLVDATLTLDFVEAAEWRGRHTQGEGNPWQQMRCKAGDPLQYGLAFDAVEGIRHVNRR